MWAHLPITAMQQLSRAAKVRAMGLHAQQLLEDGYSTDADYVLDEINALKTMWALEDSIAEGLTGAEA